VKKHVFLTSFFFLMLLSCSLGEAPFEHRYVINLVLKPDIKFQRAFVDSTYRLDVAVDEELTGISNAEVFIVDENLDTFRYGESDTSLGLYYSDDSFFVEYDMKYQVNVNVEGELISREVQVPGSLAIRSPRHLDTISLSSPPVLIWNSCKDCFENTYMVTSYIVGDTDDIGLIPMLTPDTMIGIFYNRFLFKDKDTMYTVLVEAMDSNAYNFFITWGEYGELKEGTAIGLIGAVVFDTIAVWVQE
jgi:hypothetical protein